MGNKIERRDCLDRLDNGKESARPQNPVNRVHPGKKNTV